MRAGGPKEQSSSCTRTRDTKTRLDCALANEAFRAAVSDYEVVQRNLVPKHKGLKIIGRKCG